MIRKLVIALALCLLFLPSKCSAQFQNHFSTYTTQSLESDGITVDQTYQIEGYTTVQVPPGMRAGAVHTPHVYNTLGSVGGWTTGGGGCASCYVNFATTVSAQDIGDALLPGDTGGNMVCSIAGEFFLDPIIIYNIHIGKNTFVLLYNDGYNCYYQNYCNRAGGTPSCPNENGLDPSGEYVAIGGMDWTPPCSYDTYVTFKHLVVNYVCVPVGIIRRYNTPPAEPCQ